MSKIVITGGCGYIGSHISRALKKANTKNQVFVIDSVRRDHTLKDINGYLIDDFSSKQSLLWIEKLEPDVIVHCAGSSLVGKSVSDPSEYYNNNISKTEKLLSFVKDLNKLPLMLFSSSASVYGNPSKIPIVEDDPKIPISPYGFSKFVIERMFQDYNHAYNLPSICFRYFNAAGAEPFNHDLGQSPGASHIIANILEAKLNNKPFVLNGKDFNTPDHTCIRDYIHVWDIANAHVLAINWGLSREEKIAIAINLGTKKGISNQEIIDYIKNEYDGINVAIGDRRAGDPDFLVADATLAYNLLKWKPEYSTIEKIVDSAYQWYTTWYKLN
jgi:UDP-glucose 4-epimerase